MVAHGQLSAAICDTRIKKKKRCRGAELVGKKRNGTGRDGTWCLSLTGATRGSMRSGTAMEQRLEFSSNFTH